MKKAFVLIITVLLLTGCSKSEMNDILIAEQEQKISQLKSDIKELQKQKDNLNALVVQTKEEKSVAKYIVTIKIKQSHMFWDLENNIKDNLNEIEIEIPVDKEFYDSVEMGTVINDSFRMGSLILSGSVGNWDITVADKEVR